MQPGGGEWGGRGEWFALEIVRCPDLRMEISEIVDFKCSKIKQVIVKLSDWTYEG